MTLEVFSAYHLPIFSQVSYALQVLSNLSGLIYFDWSRRSLERRGLVVWFCGGSEEGGVGREGGGEGDRGFV